MMDASKFHTSGLPKVQTTVHYTPDKKTAMKALEFAKNGQTSKAKSMREPHKVLIHDVRHQMEHYTIPKDGFAWLKRPSPAVKKGQSEEDNISAFKISAEELVKEVYVSFLSVQTDKRTDFDASLVTQNRCIISGCV